jgi:hypothetical protein
MDAPTRSAATRFTAALLACASAGSLALASAAIDPPDAAAEKKKPPKMKHDNCAPGALTTDQDGKVTHVCNKGKKWVKVVQIVQGGDTKPGTAVTVDGRFSIGKLVLAKGARP